VSRTSMLTLTLMVCCLSTAALAQRAEPTIVMTPVTFDRNDALLAEEDLLTADFWKGVHDIKGVTVSSLSETRRVQDGVNGAGGLQFKDYDVSDKSVAAFAAAAGAMYGLAVTATLQLEKSDGASAGAGRRSPKKAAAMTVLDVSARVVRAVDGKQMLAASGQARVAPKASFRVPFRVATGDLLSKLDFAGLPRHIEASAGVSSPPPPTPLESAGERPPLPPLVAVKQDSPPAVLRPLGYAGLAVGAASLVAGGITFFAAPPVRLGATGGVLEEDLGSVRASQNMQRAGVALLTGGAVLAAAGGVMLYIIEKNETPVSATLVPTSGGATLVFGGAY